MDRSGSGSGEEPKLSTLGGLGQTSILSSPTDFFLFSRDSLSPFSPTTHSHLRLHKGESSLLRGANRIGGSWNEVLESLEYCLGEYYLGGGSSSLGL